MSISKTELKKQQKIFGENLNEVPDKKDCNYRGHYENKILHDNPKDFSTIVIGGSPNILNYEYGSEIDTFDKIIRLNSCVTENLEKHVGSKTNIWVTSGTKDKWKERWDGYFFPSTLLDSEIWFRTEHTLKDYGLLAEKYYGRDLNFRVLRYKFKATLSNKPRNSDDFGGLLVHKESRVKYGGYPFLTTGMMAIFGALKFYKEVTIAGFTFYTESDNAAISNVYSGVSLDENLKQYAQSHRNMLKPFVESGRLKFLIPEEKEIFNNI